MATTTTNFGWTVPQSTDLVKDGATAISTLGSGIDTSLVGLKGGTTGQYLTKTSGTDLAYTWVTNTATPAVVPWKSASVYRASGTFSTGTAVANTTYYLPIIINATGTLDRIQVTTSATFSGTASVRLGIYNMDGTGLPSTVLLDAGTVSCTAASTNYSITISQAVTPGIYYLAANSQTAATINSYTSQLTLYTPAMPQTNGTSTGSSIIFYSQTGVTGAFATAASLTGLSTQNNISPIVRLA